MMVRGVPVLDAGGAVIEYVGMHTDVTEQKLAEDALIKTEKLAAAGRLAATVAHEINNPLEAATNRLYLLGTEQNLSQAGRDYITAAERELSRVAHVLRQTLGFYSEQSSKEEVLLQELIDPDFARPLRPVAPLAQLDFDEPALPVAETMPEPEPEQPAAPKPRARKGKPPVPAWEDVLLGVRSSGQR